MEHDAGQYQFLLEHQGRAASNVVNTLENDLLGTLSVYVFCHVDTTHLKSVMWRVLLQGGWYNSPTVTLLFPS